MRAQNDLINFALARREFSVGGKRARDVRRVARVLPADVEQDNVAAIDLPVEFVVMQHGGIEARADDGRVGLGLAAGVHVNLDHFRRHLIFVQPRAHHFHGCEMRVNRSVDRLLEQREFAG